MLHREGGRRKNCGGKLTSAIVTATQNVALGKNQSGRRSGLKVSALVPGASGPGSSPGREHCVVFLGKTLNSHSASLHPGV